MTTLARLTTALASRYRVDRELGAGGMATVYLAHDLKHEREVAIKVLHPDLGAALGGERFLTEIKTTAKLQHPHILPLLDSGEADGLLYYVMPYVRGETLRARLERDRQLAIDDAIRIASEVGDALSAAHALGIVHRDIKPENVLLQDGHALVADFGIALAVQTAGGARMTQTGLSLGTPQYMSPEQAVGEKSVDARSDQYALAAVTYEMLTGDPPFQGNNVQAIIARVISSEPEAIHTLRKTVPTHVAAAVTKGLAKLPADRFAGVRQFVAALGARSSAGIETAALPAPPFRPRVAVIGGLMLAAGLGGGWALRGPARSAGAGGPVAVSIELPPNTLLDNAVRALAISPDGRTAVVVASDTSGQRRLYRRRIDQAVAEPMPGTEGGGSPVFSPDGEWIAFMANGILHKMRAAGGPVIDLTELDELLGIAWVNAATIVAGTPAGIVTVNADRGERLVISPVVATNPLALPDGKSMLYAEWTGGLVSARVRHRILDAVDATPFGVDSIVPLSVVPGGVIVAMFDGRIGFVPTTPDFRQATGVAQPLLQGVLGRGGDVSQAIVSASGALLYQPGDFSSDIVRFDPRTLRADIVSDEPRHYLYPRLSPDGRRFAVSASVRGDYDLRIVELADRSVRRLTMPGSQVRAEWTPDGSALLFEDIQGDTEIIRSRVWNGSDVARDIQRRLNGSVTDADLSPDGTIILYKVIDQGKRELYWRAMSGDTVSRRFASNSQEQNEPRFSPDGRWIAWRAGSFSAPEVFVARFPSADQLLQVSDHGGEQPVWSHDGQAVYYATGRGKFIVKASLSLTGQPRVVRRDTVVRTGYDLFYVAGHQTYDVFPDGTLLLSRRRPQPRFPVLILNWWDRAKREVRAK